MSSLLAIGHVLARLYFGLTFLRRRPKAKTRVTRSLTVEECQTHLHGDIASCSQNNSAYFQYWNNIPAYYAYDRGAWRIYSLNSEISVSSSSPQVTWLKNDLAAHPHACVLAYWHRPRWSSGTTRGSATSMQALWDALYAANADVVENGHEYNLWRAQTHASRHQLRLAVPPCRRFDLHRQRQRYLPLGFNYERLGSF
jgi:hypothetical protein